MVLQIRGFDAALGELADHLSTSPLRVPEAAIRRRDWGRA